jgi:uncharacterized protein YidB (DUF937 family)
MNSDEPIEPSISGVPEEVQQNIIEDIKNAIEEEQAPVCKIKIGVSISENEDLEKLGFANIHLKDLMVEIARNLLINDFSIIYGGDLRKEGYTEIFSGLAYQYRSMKDAKKACFENYFSFPIYLQLTKAHVLEFKKNRTAIIKVPPPQDLMVDANQYIRPDSPITKYIWARSLSAMRNEMIGASNGRILVGGKINHYLGMMPGVLEEAKITLEQDKPLYLVGGYGGCAKYVADALLGKALTFAKDAFHSEENYKSFKSYYNEQQPEAPINLENTTSFFHEYGIERLASKNGLSTDENLRLFTTPHQSEIIYLIFKGINNLH